MEAEGEDNIMVAEKESSGDILESILAQKMARASVMMRSNSIQSVGSTCSAGSFSTIGSNQSDRCRCDDCLLGITDLLVDFSVPVQMPDGSIQERPLQRKVREKEA